MLVAPFLSKKSVYLYSNNMATQWASFTGLCLDNLSFTVTAWVRPLAFPAGADGMIILSQAYNSNTYGIFCTLDGAYRPYFNVNLSAVNSFSIAGAACPQNTWSHVAYTYNASTLKKCIYRNGTLLNQHTGGGSCVPGRTTCYLFQFDPILNQNRVALQGNVKDVAVWTTELSSTDIATIYNNGAPFDIRTMYSNNLVAYYTFDGNSLVNRSGNGSVSSLTFQTSPSFSSVVP